MDKGIYTIMVLSDEDTWTMTDGCKILVIDEAALTLLNEGEPVGNIEPIAEIPIGGLLF